MQEYDFSRLSDTAFGIIYACGTYTDIPRAKETLHYLQQHGCTLSGESRARMLQTLSAFFEARHKAINHALSELHATQVLELAAGFSPRGINLSAQGVLYVETDLADTMARKRLILHELFGELPHNFHLTNANVLNKNDLQQACTPFQQKPVMIVHEGLLRYLTHAEKKQLAANIGEILRRYGGAWITPDIHLQQWALRQKERTYMQTMTQQLGRDPEEHHFATFDDAKTFFTECGFDVEERPLLDGIRGNISAITHAPPWLVEELNERRIYIMRVR